MLDGMVLTSDVNCFDLCDIVRLKLTTFVDSLNAHVMNDDSGYFLGVCVTSLFILPAVILLWVWNKETPTLKREK